MKKYKAIIVDDELHGRENLRALLNAYVPEIAVVGEARSAREALLMIDDLNPDVVFLDILMPVKSGFDLLEQIPERRFAVIFVSASLDFGIQAVKAGVLDYLLKPINITELQEAAQKVIGYFGSDHSESENDDQQKIVLSQANSFSIVDSKDVVLLQADNNYTKVYTRAGKKYHISKPLKDFERILSPDQFVRTHRSFIINLSFLIDYKVTDNAIAILNNGMHVPVSKRREAFMNTVLKKINLFQ